MCRYLVTLKIYHERQEISYRRVDRLVSPSWFVADFTVVEMTARHISLDATSTDNKSRLKPNSLPNRNVFYLLALLACFPISPISYHYMYRHTQPLVLGATLMKTLTLTATIHPPSCQSVAFPAINLAILRSQTIHAVCCRDAWSSSSRARSRRVGLVKCRGKVSDDIQVAQLLVR